MNKFRIYLPALAAMCAVILSLNQQIDAQQPSNITAGAVAQQSSTPPPQDEPKAGESKTFTGKIVKLGDKLVLAVTADKTTYQLDDQQKAQEFLNKKVKVIGVLDAANRMIRVSAIEPV